METCPGWEKTIQLPHLEELMSSKSTLKAWPDCLIKTTGIRWPDDGKCLMGQKYICTSDGPSTNCGTRAPLPSLGTHSQNAKAFNTWESWHEGGSIGAALPMCKQQGHAQRRAPQKTSLAEHIHSRIPSLKGTQECLSTSVNHQQTNNDRIFRISDNYLIILLSIFCGGDETTTQPR